MLALALVAFTMPAGIAAAAQSEALPAHAPPGGLHSIDGAEGGRLLEGALSKQQSTDSAFRAALGTIRAGYFDTTPALVGVVRSTDQRLTIGAFTATLRGAAVNGMVYTIFDPSASSRVGVFFDVPKHFAKTFKPLMSRFTASSPGAHGAAPLRQVVAPDRTEAVTLPADWQIQTLEGGVLIVRGPDQAAVIVRLLTYFTDPRYPEGPGAPPMPFTSDPVEAFSAVCRTVAARNHLSPPPELHIERTVPQSKPPGTVTSALLYGTAASGATTRRFETLVQVAPLNAQGRWIVQVNQISAPADVFRRDLPLLSTIYQSYRYDSKQMGQVILRHAQVEAEKNSAIFRDSMRRAAVIQHNIDRSTAAFVDYISDHAVITDGNLQGRFEANTAAAIVKADPNHWHIMSLNEYR